MHRERKAVWQSRYHIHKMHYHSTAHKRALLCGKQHDQVHVCILKDYEKWRKTILTFECKYILFFKEASLEATML